MTLEISTQNTESINKIKISKKDMRKEFDVKPSNTITNIVVWAAKERHPLAMYLMGLFFLGYYKVYPDFDKAVFWLKRAIKYKANEDFGGVEYYLGHCYENGFGIGQDIKKALELYNISAHKNFPKAMKKLSVCYAKGFLGCNVDKILSDKWNKLYEKQEKYIWNMDDQLSNAGYKVEMFAGEEQLIDVIEDAREVGNIEAEYCLGLFYDAGFGGVIMHDEKLALQCFKTAASQGHAGAMYCLAKYIEKGKGGCKKEPDVAMELYNEAALNGDEMAKELINQYKNLSIYNKTQNIIKEQEEELNENNKLISSKIKTVQETLVNNEIHKKEKGKAPEDSITTDTTTCNIVNTDSNNTLSNHGRTSNDDGSSGSTSKTSTSSISIPTKLSNNYDGKHNSLHRLTPLIEETSTVENVKNEFDAGKTEFSLVPLSAYHDHLTEPERELNEEEKRRIITNKIKKISEEYNKIVDEINEDNKIKYIQESKDKNQVLNEVPDKDRKDNEKDDDHKTKIKRNHSLINKVKDFGNKLKHNPNKSEKTIENNQDIKESNTIIEKTKEGLKELGQDVKNASGKTSEKTKKGLNKTEEIESDIKEGIEDTTSKTEKKLKNISNDMKNSINGISSKIGESKVSQEFKNLGEKTKGSFRNLGDKTKEFGSNMKSYGQKLKDSSKIKETEIDIKDTRKDTSKDTSKDVVDSNGSKLKNFSEKTKDGIKSLGDKTKELGSDIKDGINCASTKIEESKVGQGFKNLGEKTKDGIRNLGDKTKHIGSSMKNYGQELKDSSNIKENEVDVKNKSKDIGSTCNKSKNVDGKSKDGLKNISDKTKELGNEIKEPIEPTSSKISESKIGQGMKNIGNKTKESLKNLGDDIKNLPSKTNEKIKDIKENIKDKQIEKELDDQSKLDKISKTEEIKENMKEVNEKVTEEVTEKVKAKTSSSKNKNGLNTKKSFGFGFKKFLRVQKKK